MRFVLVHGGFHGAWCWERLIPELDRLGHEAVALDLPGHGRRRDERSRLADRRDAIVEILRPGDVLVGHSGGGYDMSLAADAVPDKVRHLVYLAAGLPLEGKSVLEATGGASDGSSGGGEEEVTHLMDDETGMSNSVRPLEDGRMEWVSFEGAWQMFYNDCDEQTARAAFERLTPAPVEFLTEPVSIPNFWAAQRPRSYIRCLQDHATPDGFCEAVADRMGVEPLTIDSSHSPFLSRPAELAELLVRATETVPRAPMRPA